MGSFFDKSTIRLYKKTVHLSVAKHFFIVYLQHLLLQFL